MSEVDRINLYMRLLVAAPLVPIIMALIGISIGNRFRKLPCTNHGCDGICAYAGKGGTAYAGTGGGRVPLYQCKKCSTRFSLE